MNSQATRPSKIDRRLEGDPIQVDAITLRPVARLTGLAGYGGDRNGGGGAWVTLKPQEVVVHKDEGAEERVALPDPTAMAVRGIAVAAVAVAVAAWLLMFLAWLVRSRLSAE